MTKSKSLSQIVNELRESILVTSRKQRRIRSGTFWSKFGFERRTKERVEAVKVALADVKIEINLEDSFFGSEKRGELIVLRVLGSTLNPENQRVKNHSTPPVILKEIGEPAFESVHKYDRIEAKLNHLAEVSHLEFDITTTFSQLFVELFRIETPNYELSPGIFGATRSNWTYHTAIAIAQACKILELNCRFEAHGKRDAIIETKEQSAEIVLAAEWEWDYEDIFGKGKELDKLKVTCKTNPTANAFLLVYCPNSKYLDYLERIAEDWIQDPAMDEQAPTLFLHTVIFEERGTVREFQLLKTVMIHTSGILVWTDRFL